MGESYGMKLFQLNKWSKKKSGKYLHKENLDFFTKLFFFYQNPVLEDASWHLLNSRCVLLTLESGVGGLGNTWRWHCSVNAQQKFHWFNSMDWAPTIHAELC